MALGHAVPGAAITTDILVPTRQGTDKQHPLSSVLLLQNIYHVLQQLPPPFGATAGSAYRDLGALSPAEDGPILNWDAMPAATDPCTLLDNPENTTRRKGVPIADVVQQLQFGAPSRQLPGTPQLSSATASSLASLQLNPQTPALVPQGASDSQPQPAQASQASAGTASAQAPKATAKGDSRGQQKRWQVESFLLILSHLLPPSPPTPPTPPTPTDPSQSCGNGSHSQGDVPMRGLLRPELKLAQQQQQETGQQWQAPGRQLHVVDFGCGTGGLLLPLAHLFPHVTFTGVEMKPAAVRILERRAAAAGLTNVRTFLGMIEAFTQPFDVALALHACGNATDHALARAQQLRAAFLVSPCCVGG